MGSRDYISQRQCGLDIDICTRVPGLVKYLTLFNSSGTCGIIHNGRLPSLAGSMTAWLRLWHRLPLQIRLIYQYQKINNIILRFSSLKYSACHLVYKPEHTAHESMITHVKSIHGKTFVCVLNFNMYDIFKFLSRAKCAKDYKKIYGCTGEGCFGDFPDG